MVFTETIQGIYDGFYGRNYRLYTSHNLPTPDSFNTLIAQALKDGCEHIYITNDDVVVNKQIVDRLYDAEAAIAFCPTPIGDFHGYYEKDGEVYLIGTSAILCKREVLERMQPLETKRYITQGDTEYVNGEMEFGGEEVSFSKQALALGYKLTKIDGMARHLRLVELGEHRSNKGCHKIEEL